MSTKYQGIARPVVASKVNGRSSASYEYSSVKAFAEIELGYASARHTVTRRCNHGGGVVKGWNVRYL